MQRAKLTIPARLHSPQHVPSVQPAIPHTPSVPLRQFYVREYVTFDLISVRTTGALFAEHVPDATVPEAVHGFFDPVSS